MSLEKIRDDKMAAADYIVSEIKHVVDEYGKRESGSDNERAAIEYMAETLRPCVDEVKVEPFKFHPGAFMGWIYITVTMVLLAFACYFIAPVVSVVLILLGVGLMLGEFILYRKVVDKLFREKTSHNVTAIKKPTGDVKRRIFINGHADAAYEWTFNYHLGGVGFIGHFFLSILGVVFLLVISVISLCKGNFVALQTGGMLTVGLISLIFIIPIAGMYWLWNEERVVDGANDDLTGCYMGIALLKFMKDNDISLENTEVGVIISGSEEAGLRGAKAWCEQHANDYKDVETLIFSFDTIHEGKFLGVNKKDLNNMVTADEKASALYYNAAEKLGIPCCYCSVPLGATDSAAFNQGGFRATGITAMNHNLQRYYHTRDDTADNLDKQALADCFAVAVQTLIDYSNE